MQIKQFTLGYFITNIYLVADEKTKKALLIDTAPNCTSLILNFLKKNKLKLIYIINTHAHIDHIAENFKLKKLTNAKLLIHKLDASKLLNPAIIFPLKKIQPIKADFFLKNNQIIKLGNLEFKIIHTPGHTSGSICIYNKKDKVLFSGDTLFRQSYGRTDLNDGNNDDMINSLRLLANLDNNVKVYPGHGPSTLIKDEAWLKNL